VDRRLRRSRSRRRHPAASELSRRLLIAGGRSDSLNAIVISIAAHR
jgi:hypothetical protein